MRIPIEPEVYDLIFTEGERDGLWPVESGQARAEPPQASICSTSAACGCRCLSAFDQPDAITSCPVRPVSTHALQALSLFNSSFMQEVVARFRGAAGKVLRAGSKLAQIDTAWQPGAGRVRRVQQRSRWRASFFKTGGSLPDFCLALFNRNEFVYVP